MLLVTAVLFELFFRSGLYNRFLNPNSLMGNAFNKIYDIKKFGFNNVDWITVGDSKTDWGINHGELKNAQKNNNTNHVRFSLAGSNYMTIHSSIEWSMDNFINLDGIMLGMYEHEFFRYSNPDKEFKISWPFRKYLDLNRFKYFKNVDAKFNFIQRTALYNYLPDLKDFLVSPIKRFNALESANKNWSNNLNFNINTKNNLCEYDLSSLSACVALANQYKDKKSPKGFGSPIRNCGRQTTIERLKTKQWKTDPIDFERYFTEWTNLFNKVLNRNKKLTLILLPEYAYYDYMGKPSNAHIFIDNLKSKYADKKNFEIIDLRFLFKENDECAYYSDVVHFNAKGAEKVTSAIINQFNK